MTRAEIIIVGSGPAGVSAAWPLVEAGRNVLMLDGADSAERPATTQAERALGAGLEGLSIEDGLSPKLHSPQTRLAVSRFAAANRVRGENFVVVGALARGGLSRIWGAFAGEFDAADIADWPVAHAELAPSYARIAARIGISGSTEDAAGRRLGTASLLQPPLPLGTASASLLARYGTRPSPALALGHARNAVLSKSIGERPACDLRNDCLFGCPIGAIYDFRQDLFRLKARANFRLVDGAVVTAVEKDGADWRLRSADGREFSAPRILLAAGTLGSTSLVAPLLPPIPQWPLLSNPVLAAPMLVPAALLRPVQATHSLAQLAFFLSFGAGAADYVSGAVYETSGLPASTFVNQLPLGRRAGEAAFRFLAPSLLVLAISFSGAFSRNRLRYDKDSRTLTVQGGFADGLAPALADLRPRLAALWREWGGVMLPGGKLAAPGTDAHFAGTLPMGGTGPNGTSTLGELAGHAGLHIVDGAILPSLPSKHATLSIMANADRIASILAPG